MRYIKMQCGYVVGNKYEKDLYEGSDPIRIMHYSKNLKTIQSLFRAYSEDEEGISDPVYIATFHTKSGKEVNVVCLNFQYSTNGKFATTYHRYMIKIFVEGKFHSQYIHKKNLAKAGFEENIREALH